MRTPEQSGFTRTELIVVVVVLVILGLVLYPIVRSARNQAVSTTMKNRGRAIWVNVICGDSCREPMGLQSIWPKNQGFDASRTSTEYFRALMSDCPIGITDRPGETIRPHGPICEDLNPSIIGGGGVPQAHSLSSFSSTNNAWIVICASTQTQNVERNGRYVPFLITRNVTMGRQVNALSSFTFNEKSPLRIQRCTYVTVGGACFDWNEKYLSLPSGRSVVLEGMGTNTVYDVMFP